MRAESHESRAQATNSRDYASNPATQANRNESGIEPMPMDAACRDFAKLRRTLVRIFAFAALCAVTSSPAFAGTVYELDLVNSSQSGIVSFEVARAGSDRFHAARFVTTPLQAGGESATVQIREADSGCRRDLRIGFADGRVLTERGFDLCASGENGAVLGRNVAEAGTH